MLKFRRGSRRVIEKPKLQIIPALVGNRGRKHQKTQNQELTLLGLQVIVDRNDAFLILNISKSKFYISLKWEFYKPTG